jgi:hypothetical protein
MQSFIRIFHIIVFVFATLTVGSIFYEGQTLQWYPFVPILILATDVLFIISTILNLVFFRKQKVMFFINIFSAVLIALAVIMKMMNLDYPAWTILVWNFYVLYLYGYLVMKKI